MSNENHGYDQAKAQMDSIAEMVAALNCDYDRLAELREARDDARFIANWNMPGYMPENERVTFETSEDAMEWLRDEAKEHAEQASEGDNEAMSNLDSVFEAIGTWQADSQGEFGFTLGNWHYFVSVNPQPLSDEDAEELADLEKAAGDCESQEEARERIEQDALSVEVRSDWVTPGEEMKAGQFRIVLCTGGPHVELVGELDEYRQPFRVWMNYAWGSESGEYHGPNFDMGAALTYCQCFYFGE